MRDRDTAALQAIAQHHQAGLADCFPGGTSEKREAHSTKQQVSSQDQWSPGTGLPTREKGGIEGRRRYAVCKRQLQWVSPSLLKLTTRPDLCRRTDLGRDYWRFEPLASTALNWRETAVRALISGPSHKCLRTEVHWLALARHRFWAGIREEDSSQTWLHASAPSLVQAAAGPHRNCT